MTFVECGTKHKISFAKSLDESPGGRDGRREGGRVTAAHAGVHAHRTRVLKKTKNIAGNLILISLLFKTASNKNGISDFIFEYELSFLVPGSIERCMHIPTVPQ